jgi:uncharacterized protein YkwD
MKKSIPFLVILLLAGNSYFVHGKEGQSIPFRLNQGQTTQKLSPAELSNKVEALIFEQTNEERQKKKLPALGHNEILVKVARDHSKDMLKRNYLSHFSPEGKSVVDRTSRYVKQIRTSLGENIHTIMSSEGLRDPKAIADQMMDDWMHSASHRKNILSKDYANLGVGCTSDGIRIYCTQVFSGPNL